MEAHQFEYLADYVRRQSGRVLIPSLSESFERRLMEVVRKYGLTDLTALVTAMRRDNDALLLADVAEAICNHESLFFRDGYPFEQLREVLLPTLLERRGRTKHLRIWSAAASTGQEPYSIAMTFREARHLTTGWNIEVVATDLSKAVLERAKKGLYTEFEIQRGLTVEQRDRYFTQEDGQWRISDDIRAMTRFEQHNLLHPPNSLGQFDVVFCRNVLIYFDEATKSQVLAHIRTAMADDGMLFLGGAESVVGFTAQFAPIPGHAGIYKAT